MAFIYQSLGIAINIGYLYLCNTKSAEMIATPVQTIYSFVSHLHKSRVIADENAIILMHFSLFHYINLRMCFITNEIMIRYSF